MWTSCRSIDGLLTEHHYLGATDRGVAWRDEHGALVLAAPTARHLPIDWLELTRWCLTGGPNAGSRQWAAVTRALRRANPKATTVISYSDPSVGHTGALYRACNWWWAPTWHRLRPPPSGNGKWSVEHQSVKDRWIFALQDDPRRVLLLCAQDEALLRRWPWAQYREPGGVPWKRWKEQNASPRVANSCAESGKFTNSPMISKPK
jgi:hypothetical protein